LTHPALQQRSCAESVENDIKLLAICSEGEATGVEGTKLRIMGIIWL